MENKKNEMVVIHAEMAAKLNFACHQNSFAYLRDLRIENPSSVEHLEDLVVCLSSNPQFLKPKNWKVDRIGPDGILRIKDRDIQLNGDFLLNLSDSISGRVTITVEQGGSPVAVIDETVELLAHNEWGGAGFMPELLPAFCMPNDPAVDRVLREANLVLRRAGKPDGIDGYESNSRERVWEITSAIYTAICNLGINYVHPPASFERDGQKVRLPGQILENRVGTCLDLTLFFAAALEQAGLYPVIALPHGHAVVGVWLQPEDLSSIVIDEAEVLRKRFDLKELLLVETTYVAQSPPPPISKAVAAALEAVSHDRDGSFVAAIDVRRARAHRITPLGMRTAQPQARGESPDGYIVTSSFEEAPELPDFDEGVKEQHLPDTPAGRLERWQRKLLDLSARNRC